MFKRSWNWSPAWLQVVVPTAIVIVAIVLIPSMLPSPYWLGVLTVVAVNVVLAMSLDLVIGYTGLLALGHVAFFGIGAYTCAILTTEYSWSYWPAVAAGGLVAALCGIVVSGFSLRLSGHYLAIATLGFAVMVSAVLVNWIDVTRGPQGILGIPSAPPIPLGGTRQLDFATPAGGFYLVALFAVLVYFLLRWIVRSPAGDMLRSVREDEVSALSVGINVFAWKVFGFSVAATVAGLTGGLYAGFLGILAPENFTLIESFTILAMVIVGGMGTLYGPALGAALLTLLPELLRAIGPDYRLIIFGSALVLTILFAPSGLAGIATQARAFVRGRRSTRTVDEEVPGVAARD